MPTQPSTMALFVKFCPNIVMSPFLVDQDLHTLESAIDRAPRINVQGEPEKLSQVEVQHRLLIE